MSPERTERLQPKQVFEALGLFVFWLVAGLMPVAVASRAGAAVIGLLGPLTAKHRHVVRNLSFVLPHARDAELRAAAIGVWRNLGAVTAEYPHLRRIVRDRVELIIPESIASLFHDGRPALFVSAHLANWEVMAGSLTRLGAPLLLVYAQHRNPAVEHVIQWFRRDSDCEYVDKQLALRAMLDAPRRRRSIGLLPDQRVDSGVMLEFFGHDAPTTISPARIALRLGFDVVPVHVERLPGTRFQVVFHPPLRPDDDMKDKDAAISITRRFNEHLESWIGAHPQHWLCTKRRWPKTAPRGRTPDDATSTAAEPEARRA